MKNKKGVTIGRILLYILFISLLGFFIYIIACTFKAIKEKQPQATTVDVIKKAYNNDFEYSAADYISHCYFNFYKTNDITYQFNNTSNINFDITSLQPIYYTDSYQLGTGVQDVINNQLLPYYIYTSSFIDDNIFNMSSLLKSAYSHLSNFSYRNSNLTYDYWNMFDIDKYSSTFPSSYDWQSAAMIIECEIPVSIFVGSISGNVNTWGLCFIQGDVGGLYGFYPCAGFNYDSLPSYIKANCSYITKIVIPLWQSLSNNVGLDYYPLGNGFNNSYSNVINNDFTFNFNFNVFTRDNSWQDGYESGYADGVSNADNSLRTLSIELQEQIDSLNSTISSLESRIASQQLEITTLNNQLQASNNNFKGLFFTMADIPFKTVSNALGFEFWGVNLFRFFVGIITALGIVWLIKKII